MLEAIPGRGAQLALNQFEALTAVFQAQTTKLRVTRRAKCQFWNFKGFWSTESNDIGQIVETLDREAKNEETPCS